MGASWQLDTTTLIAVVVSWPCSWSSEAVAADESGRRQSRRRLWWSRWKRRRLRLLLPEGAGRATAPPPARGPMGARDGERHIVP
ncbi:unnamed protein product [Lampetra fluviatilis]